MTEPIKRALCMSAASLPFLDDKDEVTVTAIPPEFFDSPKLSLRGRHVEEKCEDDPSWKQLLPYIVVQAPNGTVFCYTRGAAGAENRLHGLLSIGLGGHVDTVHTVETSLRDHLEAEANRELLEEAKLPPAPLYFRGLIYDPTNAVGQVHLGLLAVRSLETTEVLDMLAEPGVIERGSFVTMDWLLQPENLVRLENWSKAALLDLHTNFP